MTIQIADRVDHAGGASRLRMARKLTKHIILHRTVGLDANGDGVVNADDVIRFFTRDPEGIATVALGGTYASKLPTIARWRASGVPAAYQQRGFVPYHFLVDLEGNVTKCLDEHAHGAHASALNDRSVAIAFIGDFRVEAPSSAMLKAGTAVAAMLLRQFGVSVSIFDHDHANAIQKLPAKGCIGRMFPISAFIHDAVAKAAEG